MGGYARSFFPGELQCRAARRSAKENPTENHSGRMGFGKENFMKEYDFCTTPEDDIAYGDNDCDVSNYEAANATYLSAIAKTLIQIRDELRRMNDGKVE